MSGRIILKHLQDMKLLVANNSRRCNFDKELKDLSAIFNWFDEEITPFKHFKAACPAGFHGHILPLLSTTD
jgi:hypothetical protein